MKLPDFVIIGAQKAGTTTLEGWLAHHPDVWMPEAEDAFFRDPVYGKRTIVDFSEKYERRLESRLGLKCPDYLARPEVPDRLFQDLNRPRLIVTLRDPVRRAVSAYYWNMRWGTIPIRPLNVGLRSILHDTPDPRRPHAREVLEWGRYAHCLGRYYSHFPRDGILVLLEEELRFRPEQAWQRTAAFLGINEHALPEEKMRTNRNEGIYSLQRLRFLQLRRPLVLRWDKDSGYATIDKSANTVARVLSSAVAGVDRHILGRVFANAAPALDGELELELREYYREDICSLEVMIDRDLGQWLHS